MITTAVTDESVAVGSYEVDHVGVVVPDFDAAAAFYRDILGCRVSEPLVPEGQGIAVVFVPFNDFLARQPGGGLHHVCYVVDELEAVRDRLRASGHLCSEPASRSSGPVANRFSSSTHVRRAER
jgi:catechol 2,3-dioxygenase-like lactoylglutathione lyase family enzyme